MYEEIFSEVKEVIKYSQGIKGLDLNIESLKNNWEKNKKDFIDIFGGKLIYTFPKKIKFNLSNEVKEEKINDFIDNFYISLKNYDEILHYLEDLSTEEFYSNLTDKEYQYGEIIIPKGIKVVKSFKLFFNNPDSSILKDLQIQASQIIQTDKIEGYLCISVHPLDYLSISENSYHWRSCHSLDGEYAAGNLSYMTDKSTVICYIRNSEKNYYISNFPEEIPWNSKMWRMLLFFSDDKKSIFAGRQYPFEIEDILPQINSLILNNSELKFGGYGCWSKFYDRIAHSTLLNNTYFVSFGKPIIYKNLIKDMSNLHFNDLLRSSCYKPYYTEKHNWLDYYSKNFEEKNKFHIGNNVKCLVCANDYILNSDSFMCNSCNKKYTVNNLKYCINCGERINEEDEYHYTEDGILCDYCFKNYAKRCYECGRYFLDVNMVYDKQEEEFICSNCIEEN